MQKVDAEIRRIIDQQYALARKLIEGNRDKIPEADRVAVEEALKEGKTVLEANKDNPDAEALKAALETVQKASHKMAEAMYKQAGGSGPGPGAPPGGDSGVEDEGGGGDGGKKDEGVIDAEFEEQK